MTITHPPSGGTLATLDPLLLAKPHTAYSVEKFAVKGFTEVLIADFWMNAPHIRVSVIMPGHIGMGIGDNSLKGKPIRMQMG